jgi:hypothetical protein
MPRERKTLDERTEASRWESAIGERKQEHDNKTWPVQLAARKQDPGEKQRPDLPEEKHRDRHK